MLTILGVVLIFATVKVVSWQTSNLVAVIMLMMAVSTQCMLNRISLTITAYTIWRVTYLSGLVQLMMSRHIHSYTT
ncbi:hypothetical protein D3C78_1677210 [compost metagenome]